jgi:hypothetical protein
MPVPNITLDLLPTPNPLVPPTTVPPTVPTYEINKPESLLSKYEKILFDIERYTNANNLANAAYEIFGSSADFRVLNEWKFLSPLVFNPTLNPSTLLGYFDKVQEKLYDDKIKEQKAQMERVAKLKKDLELAKLARVEGNLNSQPTNETIVAQAYEEESQQDSGQEGLNDNEDLESDIVSDDYNSVLDSEVAKPDTTETPYIVEKDQPENSALYEKEIQKENTAVITEANSQVINITNLNSTGEIITTFGDPTNSIRSDVSSATPPPPPGEPFGDVQYQEAVAAGRIEPEFTINNQP